MTIIKQQMTRYDIMERISAAASETRSKPPSRLTVDTAAESRSTQGEGMKRQSSI